MRALIATLFTVSVLAALPAAQTTGTVGFMHAIHSTNDVEKTAAFYSEMFGVSGPVRPFDNPAVAVLNNTPGVTLRVTMLQLPGQGFNFELTQFGNVERKSGAPRLSDPGAPHMKFLVRSLDPVLATIRKLGTPIITRSGAPVTASTPVGKTKAIFVKDPDGYIVEVIEAPAAADAPAGNVVGAIMGVTVGDLDQSMKFWHGLLGFDLTGDRQFSSDPAMLDLMGLEKGSSFRSLSGVVPGSKARIEFTEFKGMARARFDLRTTDAGACGMAIRVAAIPDLLRRMKAEGVRVSSRNAELVEWSPTIRNVFVKDPDGLNIELVGEVAAAKE